MNISPEEAREALGMVRQTRARVKKSSSVEAYFSIIWGLVWFVGLLGNQFLPFEHAWWVWAPAVTVGWILSTILGIHLGQQTRSEIGPRIGFFFLALFVFATLWFVILWPLSLKQVALFIMTVFIFGGVAVGIITRVMPLIICDLSLAALLVLGYYLVPAYFFLWAAVFCGLALVGIGLVMLWRWR